MRDDLFSKEQIEQIKKANSKIRADLDLDKEDYKKSENKLKEKIQERARARGGAGGGGMNPADIERVPGKKPLKMKKGGSVNENAMMKKMGRGLTKAAMQKVASKVVKGHEKRMHKKYEGGGSVSASKRADGIAMKGKTKGRMV